MKEQNSRTGRSGRRWKITDLLHGGKRREAPLGDGAKKASSIIIYVTK